MPSINYFSNKVRFKLKDSQKVSSWIKKVVKKEGASIQEINYVFCSDDYLLNLNQGFLRHDTLTDIITFDHGERDLSLEGEIYISIDRVKENAKTFQVSFEEELNRVMIHGILHLLGYNDKKAAEKSLMRKKEEACLSLLK